jgi:predicted O-linked N-acetylglucosamine transferase (SPINDLY family)
MTTAAVQAGPGLEDEIALARAEILAGDGSAAVKRLTALIAASAFTPVLHYWLSAAHGAAGDVEKQRETLRTAQAYHGLQVIKDNGGDLLQFQSDADYARRMGDLFYSQKLVACASLAYGRAVQGGANPQLMLSYGLSLQHQGLMEDAASVFEVAARTYPVASIHEFLLVALMYVENGVERHAREARRWAELYAPKTEPATLRFDYPPLAGRRLRIGYVTMNFTGTQVRQFIRPVLESHDPESVEVFLYSADGAVEGELPATAIRSIGQLSDADAAALIKADKIDVLIDLWGHAAGSRLTMFALKPAPVQVSWMNYVQTTGIAAMDYVIHPSTIDQPDKQALFTEKVWTLGTVHSPFRPYIRTAPSPTPALRKGHVTFGSFNNPCKLSDPTVKGWARVLNANPGSKLILKYGYFADPILQNATCARFAAAGADPDRLEFRGHTTDYLEEYADVDLALDPSPCPGGTTTWDALACGIPVLSLRGADFYARIGVPCLSALGMDHLLAEDWDDYVRLSRSVTADVESLDALRRRVRAAFDESPVRDEIGFTRGLEGAYRQMFEAWNAKAPAG